MRSFDFIENKCAVCDREEPRGKSRELCKRPNHVLVFDERKHSNKTTKAKQQEKESSEREGKKDKAEDREEG